MILGILNRFADASTREKYDAAVAATQLAESRLKVANANYERADGNYRRANRELAAAQLDAQIQQRSADRTLAAVKDAFRKQLAERDELIARMDAELTEVSGRLQDALERLGGYEYAEAIADETRAKRYYDGLGD